MLLTGDPTVIPKLIFGEALIVVGMLLFGVSVLIVERRSPKRA